MQALVLTDGEYRTAILGSLALVVRRRLSAAGFGVRTWELGRGAHPCMGCFGCWVKTPGECVIHDEMQEVDRLYMNSDAVIILSPVVFGHFSANIKNAIDRTLPNMLPFFYRRPDGSTMHPLRYAKYPMLYLIGYGEGLDDEETELFREITERHRYEVKVEVYRGEGDADRIETLFGTLPGGRSVSKEVQA